MKISHRAVRDGGVYGSCTRLELSRSERARLRGTLPLGNNGEVGSPYPLLISGSADNRAFFNILRATWTAALEDRK